MKKLFNLFASAIVILCALTSCGSSKESAKISLGQEIEKSPAQIYAEESPKTRAWGVGIRKNKSVASTLAEYDAKAKMTRAIESAVKTAASKIYVDYEKTAENDVASSSVIDAVSKFEDGVAIIASQIVKEAHMVKENAYMQKNNAIAVYLCLELSGSAESLANDLAESAFKGIKDQIKDEDKDKIDKTMNDFKNNIFSNLNISGNE